MQAQTLINYIKNPALLPKESVLELQKLVQDFPYFQSAHLLLSLAGKKWDASLYQQSLKKTAIVISNRAHLFNLINGMDDVTYFNETTEETNGIGEPKTENPTQSELEALKTTIEDIKHELNILKATEVVAENNITNGASISSANNEIESLQITAVDKTDEVIISENELLETKNLQQEIEKSLVNAYIELEVIKTPELHHPELIKKQPESFTDWLKLLKKNNGQTIKELQEQVAFEKQKQHTVLKTNKQVVEEKTQAELKKQKQKSLIDKIIETNPGAIKNNISKDSTTEKKFFAPITQAKESLIENEHLITETLAKIYAMQGNVNKAVRAYEILSLKFPQKSVYFASLIKSLKENQ